MASPFLFAATNYCASQGVGVYYTSTAASGYPGAFVLDPTRPLLPWRTTTIAAGGDLFIDLGQARTINTLGLFYVNYGSVTVMADNESLFGTPDFDTGIMNPGQNAWNERFCIRHSFTAVTCQYWRVFIPSAPTLTGETFFETGGVFLGASTALPSETDAYPGGLEWDEEQSAEEHLDLQRTRSGGLHMLNLGTTPKTVLEYMRLGHINGAAPGTGDALAAWRTIDFAMRNKAFLWALNYGDKSAVWMMRKTSQSTWPISFPVSRSPMVLEECIGP
jgi:hypothetical protein